MINQTTRWFNYNTNPQSVTLTASSSAGTLPANALWTAASSARNRPVTPGAAASTENVRREGRDSGGTPKVS